MNRSEVGAYSAVWPSGAPGQSATVSIASRHMVFLIGMPVSGSAALIKRLHGPKPLPARS